MSYKTVRCKVSNCPFCNHADVVFLERDWDKIGNSMVEMKLLVCDCCNNVWEQKGDKVFFLDAAMTNHAKQTAGYQYHKALSKGFVWIEKETPYGGNPRSEDVIVSGQAGDEKIGVVAGEKPEKLSIIRQTQPGVLTMKMNRFADLPFKEVPKKGSDGVGGGTIDLSFLEGCQVIKAGYLDQKQLKDLDRVEGGFAIDYSRGNKAYRVVFGSSDFGLWIEWKGEIG